MKEILNPCLLVGGSLDGTFIEMREVDSPFYRVFIKSEGVENQEAELYRAETLRTEDCSIRIFVLQSMTLSDALMRIIERYQGAINQ